MRAVFNPSEAIASFRCDWEEIEPANASGARLVRCRECGLIARTRTSNEKTITVSGCGGKGRRPEPLSGPGTQLTIILKECGVASNSSCHCKAKAAQMDIWGIDGLPRAPGRNR
jgi:hypothetical protein